jgi:hypothetical protein
MESAYIFDFGRVLADFDINIALRRICSFSKLGIAEDEIHR